MRTPHDLNHIDPLPGNHSPREPTPPAAKPTAADEEGNWVQVPGRPKNIQYNLKTGFWRNTDTQGAGQ